MDIMLEARVMAVSAIVSELRANGCSIGCRRADTPAGPVWIYRMNVKRQAPLPLGGGP